jgi:hypothetical protein
MLKSIIKEEIDGFLNELKEYTDEEFINPKEINLQYEYDKLNSLLFGNSLSRVAMEWSTRKRALGHVRFRGNRVTGEREVEHLAMSNFYKMPYRVFKDVMAHEMIHVKLFFTREYLRQSGPHGIMFLREAARINSMGLGFRITPTNTEELGVSDTTRDNARTMIAMILNFDGRYFITSVTPQMLTNVTEMENLNKLFTYLVKRGRYRTAEITFVETRNPELLKVPVKRSFARGISYMPLSDDLLEELLNDNVLKSLQFGEGGMKQVAESEEGDWFEGIIV